MKRWIGQSLRRKLSVLMILSTVFPILLLGIYSFYISFQGTRQNISQTGIDILNQIETNLKFQIKDIEHTSIFLIGMQDIQQYANSDEPTVEHQSRVLGMLTNLVSSKDYISDITLYTKNSTEILSTSSLYSSDLALELDMASVTKKQWTNLYEVNDYAGKHNFLTFIRPLRSINDYEQLGWISISIDEKQIASLWKGTRLGGEIGNFYLVNNEGFILASSEKEQLAQSIEEFYPTLLAFTDLKSERGISTFGNYNDRKVMLYSPQINTNWSLIGLYPYSLYRAQSNSILQFTIITVAISILITALFILFTARHITNPLRLLTRLLSKINPDEPMPVYHSRSEDEIGQLAKSYSMLSMHIEQLKKKVVRNELRKKEADMRALQSQINPHFLYNTLSSVQWIALMAQQSKIADMIGALSDFLRFSLNKGNEFCKIEHEVEHVKNYVVIQSIRFPEKFNVDFVISPEVNERYMLKLLLQPLVENAMIHGIQKKEGKGNITVCIEQKQQRIHYMVLDNGIGMNEERLDFVRKVLASSSQEEMLEEVYGLRNVNERLILHYGPDSRLYIDSDTEYGTRIYFTTPVMEG